MQPSSNVPTENPTSRRRPFRPLICRGRSRRQEAEKPLLSQRLKSMFFTLLCVLLMYVGLRMCVRIRKLVDRVVRDLWAPGAGVQSAQGGVEPGIAGVARTHTDESPRIFESFECAICLQEFDRSKGSRCGCRNRQRCKETLPCGHQFHSKCMQRWSMKSRDSCKSCPICREPVDVS